MTDAAERRRVADTAQGAARPTCGTCGHLHRQAEHWREGPRQYLRGYTWFCTPSPEWVRLSGIAQVQTDEDLNHWCGDHTDFPAFLSRQPRPVPAGDGAGPAPEGGP